MQLDQYLKSYVVAGVSDIHFKVGRPPLCRTHGVLMAVDSRPLSPKDTEAVVATIVGDHAEETLKDVHDYDTSYSIPGFSRFRANIFKQRGTFSVVMRAIPFDVPTLDELGLPPVVKRIAMTERGLILVTGAAGTGKSSTLAAIINHINENRKCHVLTIEDPIEFLHRDKMAAINQREVGIDTGSFANAFRAALRQDPNVILVGEMRDLETIEIALRAAETGHVVLSTLHTTDAKETVGRLIDSFPSYHHKQVRVQIASTLRAVLSQRLLERADKRGRVLAPEIMVVNAAIREHLLTPYKGEQIKENMEKGRDQYGMQTFDQAMIELVKRGLVTVQEALRNASSPNDMKLKLTLD